MDILDGWTDGDALPSAVNSDSHEPDSIHSSCDVHGGNVIS